MRLPMRFPMFCASLTIATLLAACESTSTPTSPRQIAAASAAADDKRGGGPMVVVGTGNPAVDIAAVQAAVDQGGQVVLRGHFSFDAPATKSLTQALPDAPGRPSAAEVSITKAVSISGAPGKGGDMATIQGGTLPFFINAPGQSVSFRSLRFVTPIGGAMLVFAVRGFEVSGSRVEGVVPFANSSQAISIVNSNNVPSPTNPGHPENVSGPLKIVDNDFDMTGATPAGENTLALTVFSVGVPGAEVDADVSRNRIRNVTEPAINFRRIIGRAKIEHNVIVTGSLAGNAVRNAVIRVANTGSYHVAHNSIVCDWSSSDAEGIQVFSQADIWPMATSGR
jgi:hypothetical protein